MSEHPPSSEPAEPPPSPDERERRLAELEQRLAKPPGVGVLPPIAALALAGAIAVMWLQRDDVTYYFSSREPIELGTEGSYHFERALTNRYVQVHGTPTVRGTYWAERGATWVAVGLRDTPVLVKRGTFPTEDWKLGMAVGPQPDQRPFSVRGRLLARADAAKYEAAFLEHERWGEVSPRWLLVAELRPGGDLGAMAWFTALLAFAGLNAWLIVRGLVALRRRR